MLMRRRGAPSAQLAGEEAVEDHLEVLADALGRGVERGHRGGSVGPAVAEHAVEALPHHHRARRPGERLQQLRCTLARGAALEPPGCRGGRPRRGPSGGSRCGRAGCVRVATVSRRHWLSEAVLRPEPEATERASGVGAVAAVAHRLVQLARRHPDAVVGDADERVGAAAPDVEPTLRASASMLLSIRSATAAGRS